MSHHNYNFAPVFQILMGIYSHYKRSFKNRSWDFSKFSCCLEKKTNAIPNFEYIVTFSEKWKLLKTLTFYGVVEKLLRINIAIHFLQILKKANSSFFKLKILLSLFQKIQEIFGLFEQGVSSLTLNIVFTIHFKFFFTITEEILIYFNQFVKQNIARTFQQSTKLGTFQNFISNIPPSFLSCKFYSAFKMKLYRASHRSDKVR